MKIVGIIQARMTSSRLPGKLLKDVLGQPMLAWQLERTKQSSIDEIVVATTTNPEDAPVVKLAENEGVAWFRGDEHDVLSRFVGAAVQQDADVVVRMTADCPLIDPSLIDCVVDELVGNQHDCDYASNVTERSYPRGLDVEVFFSDTLMRMDRMAKSQQAREHVTVFCRLERPELFRVRNLKDSMDNSDLRWTVDTPADLELIRRIYQQMNVPRSNPGYREIVNHVRKHPELARLNVEMETWDPIREAA